MDIVEKMWAAYCEAAGGVTYDGKPLPTWEELGDDRQKCWMAAGKEAANEIEQLRKEIELLHSIVANVRKDVRDGLYKYEMEKDPTGVKNIKWEKE